MYGLQEYSMRIVLWKTTLKQLKSFETYELHLAFEDSDFHFITPEQLIEL